MVGGGHGRRGPLKAGPMVGVGNDRCGKKQAGAIGRGRHGSWGMVGALGRRLGEGIVEGLGRGPCMGLG